MKARNRLMHCLNCKNNIECWELDKEIPDGKDEGNLVFRIGNVAQVMVKSQRSDELETMDELGLLFSKMIIDALADDTLKDDEFDEYFVGCTARSLLVMTAFANTLNDSWECPGTWSYEPLRLNFNLSEE